MSNPEGLISEATKKLNKSSGFLGSIFGGSSTTKYEEASELFTQAANLYKLQRRNFEAGSAFEKASECQVKAGSLDEASNTLVEAYKSYKLENPSNAAKCLEKAIEMFIQRGQFRRSANFKSDLGELYENELQDIKSAIKSYEDASDWYKGDGANALSNKCLLKVADLNCDEKIKDYKKAATIYEQIAKESLNNNLAKWSLKEYFLKAIICRLADNNDYASANALLTRFLSWDPSFETTKEFEFCDSLIEAVRSGNADDIAIASKKFDKFTRLDGMKIKILNNIKNNIVEAPVDIEEDFT